VQSVTQINAGFSVDFTWDSTCYALESITIIAQPGNHIFHPSSSPALLTGLTPSVLAVCLARTNPLHCFRSGQLQSRVVWHGSERIERTCSSREQLTLRSVRCWCPHFPQSLPFQLARRLLHLASSCLLFATQMAKCNLSGTASSGGF